MKKVLIGVAIYLVIGLVFSWYLIYAGFTPSDLTPTESVTNFFGVVALWPLLLLNGIAKSLI